MNSWIPRTALCALAGMIAAPAYGQRSHQNNLASYGKLDQKAVAGGNGTLGRTSCGPVSLVNSLHYLQTEFSEYYDDTLIPDTNSNGSIDDAEMIAVAEMLALGDTLVAGDGWMNQKKTRAYNGAIDPGLPYEYRRTESPGTPGDDRPADPNVPGAIVGGGVTFQRFAHGKDKWFKRAGVPATLLYGQTTKPWAFPFGPGDAPADPTDLKDPRNLPKPGWLLDDRTLHMEDMFTWLELGADVEMAFTWLDNGQEQFGGHFVTVWGFDFDGDTNNDGVFDAAETATLNILDPWDNTAAVGAAVDLEFTLTKNANGSFDITYLADALGNDPGGAGRVGEMGRVKFWSAELPAPGAAGLLVLGGLYAGRRRRP